MRSSDATAGLKVFGHQGIASSFEGRGNNQRVVEAETVLPSEVDVCGVGIHTDRANWAERYLQVGNRFGDHASTKAELAAQNRCELVQDMHADRAASQDRADKRPHSWGPFREHRSVCSCRETRSPGVDFISIKGIAIGPSPSERAHPLDRPRPALIPREGDPRGHFGHDFQLVSGFQAKVLDQWSLGSQQRDLLPQFGVHA